MAVERTGSVAEVEGRQPGVELIAFWFWIYGPDAFGGLDEGVMRNTGEGCGVSEVSEFHDFYISVLMMAEIAEKINLV
jgi:hypothetical protein